MIDRMGDKASAKSTMIEAGSLCTRFSRYILESYEQALNSRQFGFQLCKATAGGGGEKECVPYGKKKIY
jgi:acetyl-CoA carboxylase biotin carboxylase subunit